VTGAIVRTVLFAILFMGTVLVYVPYFLVAHLFVVLYEEPVLRRKFGESYDRYRATVPRWLARRPR